MERAHFTLKNKLKKLKGRKIDEAFMFLYKQVQVSLRTLIHQAVFILNFLSFLQRDDMLTRAEKHSDVFINSDKALYHQS